MPSQVHLRIQQFRKQRELSQRALAERAGISTAGLSQIENGQSSPSVATLEKLADALGVPIASFFADPEDHALTVEILTSANRPVFGARQGAEVVPLGSRYHSTLFEPVLIRLQPGGEMSEELFGVKGSVEFVRVLRGRATLAHEGERYELAENQSVYYHPGKPHNWKNPFDAWCELLLVRSR
ncbi:MAG: helix-turn-helix domain-containing protein [Magnetococcales bacterium]|nr:helix-turn-helix domain-containing protein [Magnetococcales bacterium]